MMSEAPEYARYAIIAHVVHLVNRDYQAMCRDYYTLEFMDRSVDTSPIAPSLANFFDDVLEDSVSKLNFKAIVDGLGGILFQYPFQVPAYYALILRSLTVLEGMVVFLMSTLESTTLTVASSSSSVWCSSCIISPGAKERVMS